MNQVLLGASFGFLIGAVLYVVRRGRAGAAMLLGIPALMAAGVIWAHIPDIPRLLGKDELYNLWSEDPRMDIFFWHYSIDRIEAHAAWHTLVLFAMMFALLLAARRELALREEGR